MIASGDFGSLVRTARSLGLREVIAPLDRRVRHPGRHTEAAIVGDAAALKQQARIGLLPSTKNRQHSCQMSSNLSHQAVLRDDRIVDEQISMIRERFAAEAIFFSPARVAHVCSHPAFCR